MLSKISREPRELPCQPNLGKNEPKLNKTSCLDRIARRRNVVNSSHLRFDLYIFHYFLQKSIKLPIRAIVKIPNIQIRITSFVHKISTQYLRYRRIFGVGEFKYAI